MLYCVDIIIVVINKARYRTVTVNKCYCDHRETPDVETLYCGLTQANTFIHSFQIT